VESSRHSYLISDSGVRLSVPTNSNSVELVPEAGARSIDVCGGVVSLDSRTSHS
jgi:hypothetical protein